ncbi:MAG: tRNA (N(6)-L-threonylcarbamoyladenosine(37)-C(2))-methylthiotransferase MtaB [Methylobacterium sp.]|nr:tRNA (N(6)-L-threonylcarbamoyladenosine(37)-C(2))-methylthiotransferase MtaB [Methylobacterium sp.]MCA3597367.1 tRNA (N(6)-L-threonylcarbamoyladenosine(37)-C(2))-methylthiotransferase MtaB [Methylobacterium sp.]MCA3602858.1 tRNA (N(6)-L-threonylcarbamoyladenosine(37)-C(2))-methylthiotransferase MtaB [Methylobacterium sp.]MCA3605956.1 tRNA (N(6)-L-threonylcarbamoyladenosine(37)-C(2))-methylthiotransferase MtaB [Methylobacterium sp.]MCA3608250.1 tRNA (N(6)-L-threonylcarbamoyladenosine(37)-C(2)
MSAPMAQPEIVTLGCRLNTVESEAMRKAALAAGHSDLVIVNTCAVTAEAVRQARQTIRRLARENPARRIIVTGCAAQTEPETFAGMAEVSQVIGNDVKLKPETWKEAVSPAGGDFGLGETERVIVNDIMSLRETASHLIDGLEGRTRAFVQVQNGCDHRCTFCIIPYGRGNSRSVPMGEVVAQIERLVDAGYPEIVLTGVDLTSYGPDLPGQPKLGRLVASILRNVPKLARIRLSSLDCIEADPVLMELLKGETRLLPHMHLSLQAGDDLTLKRMKRRHGRADAIRFCAELRQARPDYAFGADLIAGFPTESEEMFENTLRLVEECGLAFLHVFPYSPRQGTPAARMPQVARPVIRARAARLREAGEIALQRHLARHVGREARILLERDTVARLDDFTPIRLASPASPGTLQTAKVTGIAGSMLTGEISA